MAHSGCTKKDRLGGPRRMCVCVCWLGRRTGGSRTMSEGYSKMARVSPDGGESVAVEWAGEVPAVEWAGEVALTSDGVEAEASKPLTELKLEVRRKLSREERCGVTSGFASPPAAADFSAANDPPHATDMASAACSTRAKTPTRSSMRMIYARSDADGSAQASSTRARVAPACCGGGREGCVCFVSVSRSSLLSLRNAPLLSLRNFYCIRYPSSRGADGLHQARQ